MPRTRARPTVGWSLSVRVGVAWFCIGSASWSDAFCLGFSFGPDSTGDGGGTDDGGASDDLIVPGSDSGGAIYTGDTASYPFEPGVPTEANPAQATGGTGQDIFAINIDTLSDGQFFEITDFNEAEDTLVLTNASEHAPPDSLVVSSVEAQPAEDGSYTDVLLHTDSGEGDTLTTIRLMGVSDYNPDNLLFSERVNMPIGPMAR